MKKVYLALIILILIINLSGCAVFDAFTAEAPPELINYGYPKLVDIPSTKFTWYDNYRVLVDEQVLRTMHGNVASCLNTVDAFATQVSTYNEWYGKAMKAVKP